jgi:NAD(P)-dependent dehydrogenase (short-subunit alcohol dehydrogenase family)
MIPVQPVHPDTYIPDRMRGKVLLVTGAAIGSIGGCVAIRAGREGAKVACVDCKVQELAASIAEIQNAGGEAIAIVADVASAADADRMVRETVEAFGKLDIVLNAAGVMDGTVPGAPADFANQKALLPNRIHEASDEYWHKVFASNVTGIFYSMRAELKQMISQKAGGSIVNIGSIAALTGLPGNPAYVASKHAVTGLTRNAAIDYAPYGIRVNSVNMAQTDTPMVARAYEYVAWAMAQGTSATMAGAKTQSLLQINDPKHRGSTPWEQAAIILFLLSDDASNITGAAYATDGGWTAY